MKKLLIDSSILKSDRCVIGFWVSDGELIPAGVSINYEQESEKAKKWAEEYDVHFFTNEKTLKIDFYPVPAVEIFGFDSLNGYLGILWNKDGKETVIYLDQKRNAFYLADTTEDFLANAANWQAQLEPFNGIEIFPSKEAAGEKYEFFEPPSTLIEGLKTITEKIVKK